MTVEKQYEIISALDIKQVAIEAVRSTLDPLLDKQKEQWLEGKNKQGLDITPSYLDDPYFKSRDSAQRYSDWKDKITPNPKRRKGTPNLFINGKLHKSANIKMPGEEVIIDIAFKPQAITAKFSNNIFGLGGENKEEYLRNTLQPAFARKVSDLIGLKYH